MHPFDESNLVLHGFDFSKPVTIHFFDQVFRGTYYPGGKMIVWPPATTPPGTYRIWAEQGNLLAESYVYLDSWHPYVVPSKYYVHVGEQLTFEGYGFAAGEHLRVLVDGKASGREQRTGSGTQFYYTQGRLIRGFPWTVPGEFRGRTVTFSFDSVYSSAPTVDVTVSVAP